MEPLGRPSKRWGLRDGQLVPVFPLVKYWSMKATNINRTRKSILEGSIHNVLIQYVFLNETAHIGNTFSPKYRLYAYYGPLSIHEFSKKTPA